MSAKKGVVTPGCTRLRTGRNRASAKDMITMEDIRTKARRCGKGLYGRAYPLFSFFAFSHRYLPYRSQSPAFFRPTPSLWPFFYLPAYHVRIKIVPVYREPPSLRPPPVRPDPAEKLAPAPGDLPGVEVSFSRAASKVGDELHSARNP